MKHEKQRTMRMNTKKLVKAGQRCLALVAAMSATVIVTGCTSTGSTTVYEYDKDGKIVKETKTTSDSIVKTITESTKDKSVIAYDNSWLGYLSVSTATTEFLNTALFYAQERETHTFLKNAGYL